MKYRAVAMGSFETGKTPQSFSAHEGTILKWAKMIAEAHQCEVKVFIWEERLISTVAPQASPENPCNYNHEALGQTSERETCPQCGVRLKLARRENVAKSANTP